MKKAVISVFTLLTGYYSLHSQTAVLYNSASLFYSDAGSIIFVDGDIVNDATGHIKNSGDIYLTKDWTNNEAAGALDPATGKVILEGGAQFIKGTQTTTFNNLDCQNSGIKTLNINTIVGGTTGVLSLNNAPFDLNSNTLIVTNPLPSAITRNTGYIISETDPTAGYGTIDWRIGNSAAGNNYVYPFGTVMGTYIPFRFDITTAGVQSATGDLAVATYPTNTTASPNNRPLPTGVTNLNDASGNESADICADRFWVTNANNYTTIPVANISFSYLDAEWDNSSGSTNNLVEDSLKAWRWSGAQWLNPSMGTDNSALNTVSASSVNTFSVWTLKGAPPCAITVSVTATPTTITLGDSVQITALGNGTFLWNTGATTASIFVSPTSTTAYCVTITDINGVCKDSSCITINVDIPCGDFFLPNAFSPNGDGHNDFFQPRNKCIKDIDMKIFNRWGNIVFETTDITKGWDGSTPKGKNGNEGVYAYEITGHFNDGTEILKKGTVNLMK